MFEAEIKGHSTVIKKKNVYLRDYLYKRKLPSKVQQPIVVGWSPSKMFPKQRCIRNQDS